MTPAQIKAALLAKLAGSLLDAADAKKLGFKLTTAEESKKLGLPAAGAGFVIPYFDLHGKATKFFRYRYLEDTRKGFSALGIRKPLRYGQTANTVNEIYLPPIGPRWPEVAENIEVPIIITEGELKSACVTKMGFPTIGLGGVWCFMSKRAGVTLLPQLRNLKWKGRTAIICYDSDAVTNPDVVMAENVLAQRLLEQGANVCIARIPALPGRKQGVDDYLLEHSFEQFQHEVMGGAIAFAQSAALHELSSRVVYIRNPGLIYDYEHQMRMTAQAFTQHAHSNVWYDAVITAPDGGQKVQRKLASKAWLEWQHRAELSGLTFAPGQDRITTGGELNLWQGWAVEPAKGSVTIWQRMLDHLFLEDKASRQWFERWCAYPLQNPGVKMASAAVIWGVAQGTGKTLVGHTLMRIYGANSVEVKDADLEDARFEWAENKQFVLADDITGHDNRRISRKFMTMITQKQMRLNPKYVPSYTVPDCINYYFTSNDPDAFFMDDGDRRFFIHEVRAQSLDEALRKEFVKWRDSDTGIAALFHYLLTLDLGGFDPQAPALRTEAKREMQHMGKSELGVWVQQLKESPEHILKKTRGDLFTANELHLLYDPLGTKRASANALGRELKRAGFAHPAGGSPLRTEQGFKRVYAVRNGDKWLRAKHAEAIKHYEESRAIIRKF